MVEHTRYTAFPHHSVCYAVGMKAGRRMLAYVLLLAAPFVAGAIGGFYTTPNIAAWYAYLVKPSWTPPSWVFGPVWTLLYLLMGIAAVLVWRMGKQGRARALTVYGVQLVLNALWSVVFFGLHAPAVAFAVIIVLWLAIVWLIALFARHSRTAAWLLVPYLLWVTYAATLNLGIVLFN